MRYVNFVDYSQGTLANEFEEFSEFVDTKIVCADIVLITLRLLGGKVKGFL
jgi:hypothetical protein